MLFRELVLKPGMKVTLELENGDFTTIWIGDATIFHGPSTNDGGFGWTDKYLNARVDLVDDYSFVAATGDDD